jgi:hypothetical protein
MECSICLEELINKESIVVDCNHIFHKRCIFYANKDKSINKCSLCRGVITIPDIIKIKKRVNITDTYTQGIIDDIVNLMDGETNELEFQKYFYNDTINKSWFVVGSFALFLFKKYIKEEEYEHNYTDVDIYTFQDYIFHNEKFISMSTFPMKPKTEFLPDFIEYIKKIEIENKLEFSRIKSIKINEENGKENLDTKSTVVESTSEIKINYVKIVELNDSIKNILKNIFKTYDVSCCRLGVRIIREENAVYTFKFYIDKSFYYNTYKVKDEYTLQKVLKYKFRGINLVEEE